MSDPRCVLLYEKLVAMKAVNDRYLKALEEVFDEVSAITRDGAIRITETNPSPQVVLRIVTKALKDGG